MNALLYLHGFASGPKGLKGIHCHEWADRHQIPFIAPDLNLPTFECLTISSQVKAVEALIHALPEPPVVVGSSLGGFVAAAVAQRGTPLKKLILLAPGFGFARRRLDCGQWAGYRKYRRLPVFHHAENRWIRLGSHLLDDLEQWRNDEDWQLAVDLTIIHGRRDEVVNVAESRAFLERHPHAKIHIVDDDHGLLSEESLKILDDELAQAFGIQPTAFAATKALVAQE